MLSVIIPNLNSSDGLAALLAFVDGKVDECVVSDGCSGDDSLCVATRYKARIAIGGGGRGGQLARGADWSLAQGPDDWLLFLHADSQLQPGWEQAVHQHMKTDGSTAAYFRFAINDAGFWPKLFQTLVALRCWIFALPYGDQGLLIRRDLYRRVGGYPDWPLFEDVSLIRRLGRRRLTALLLPLVTDACKYRRDGYIRRGLKNMGLLARYFCGASPVDLARRYR